MSINILKIMKYFENFTIYGHLLYKIINIW